MFDLNSLAALAETASGAIGGGAAFWKFFVAPGKKFRANVTKTLKNIDERLTDLEKKLQSEIDETDKEFKRDIDDIKKQQDDLKETLKDHIRTVETKNNQLLDLIIKYFTEKD